MVSFCALQLEIEDQLSNTVPDIEFNCNRTLEGLFRDLEISNPVARIKPCRQDPESYRGTRQMSKIVIETYSDFKSGMSNAKGEKEKSSSNCSKVTDPISNMGWPNKSHTRNFPDYAYYLCILLYYRRPHHHSLATSQEI